jgi:NADH:ubiquinone oxidoreductase subunit F (NADH-binding)
VAHSACGVAETARVARYLAAESAGQCGPCVFGLDALASSVEAIAACDPGAALARERLSRLGRRSRAAVRARIPTGPYGS